MWDEESGKTEFGAVEMDEYSELKEKFEANRDDGNAIKMAAYMRNLFSFMVYLHRNENPFIRSF